MQALLSGTGRGRGGRLDVRGNVRITGIQEKVRVDFFNRIVLGVLFAAIHREGGNAQDPALFEFREYRRDRSAGPLTVFFVGVVRPVLAESLYDEFFLPFGAALVEQRDEQIVDGRPASARVAVNAFIGLDISGV